MNVGADHGLTPAALFGEAILRALIDQIDSDAPDRFEAKAIAEASGRPLKNIRRELAQLVQADLISDDWNILPEGVAQIEALDRAAGVVTADTPRWPLDLIDFNPLNPRHASELAGEGIAALGDTIVSAEDLLQPILLTPVQANGRRMLLAGHRRVAACHGLKLAGVLPPALETGLPFAERDADESQALLIAVIENGGRQDLSPLDDALALHALQQRTGWSGRELARKTGRAPNLDQGDETGVRDVQRKIKIAETATPEAVAQYRLDGSWDRLRESVQAEKPPTADPAPKLPPAPAVESPATPAPAPPTPATDSDGQTDIALTDRQKLLLSELYHAGAYSPERAAGDYAPTGSYWLDANASVLQQHRLIDFKHGERPYARVTPTGHAWMIANGVVAPASDLELSVAQFGFERPDDDRYATTWLNTLPGTELPTDPGPGPQAEDGDEWMSEEQFEDAIAKGDELARQCLAEAEDFVSTPLRLTLPADQQVFKAFLDKALFPPPFSLSQGPSGARAVVASNGEAVAYLHEDGRSHAIGLAIITALHAAAGVHPSTIANQEGEKTHEQA